MTNVTVTGQHDLMTGLNDVTCINNPSPTQPTLFIQQIPNTGMMGQGSASREYTCSLTSKQTLIDGLVLRMTNHLSVTI